MEKRARLTRKSIKRRFPPRMLYHEKKAHKARYNFVAGIDEAGRGPLAGPVVASSVILMEYIFENRIDDSKKLTPAARLRAYQEIIQKSIFGIGIVNEDIIDRINIYQATVLAMEKAVHNMAQSPDILLIDGTLRLNLPQRKILIPKGDSKSLSIACASIIAKVTRDKIMQEFDMIYPDYGFGAHKGYGTKRHREALLEHGSCPIHRFTFKPIRGSNK